MKLLLDRGANIEAKGNDGNTALMQAVIGGQTETVKLLLDSRANIEARNDDGYTPLLEAARYAFYDTATAKILLDRGANVEVKNNDGRTPLMEEAENGKTGIVNALLDRGANIEDKDKNGDTALMLAASSGRTETVKLLLDRSANIEAKNNYGDTALSQAIISKHADVSQLLQQTNPRGTLNQYLAQLRTLHGSDDCKRCSNSDRNPDDSLLREQIIKLAVKLQPPPAVPEEAHQALVQSAALLQQRSPDAADVQQAIADLRKAILLAPWYPEAYYNLALALEANRQYDEAAKQLNYYLELNPSPDDTRSAKDLTYKLSAEREAAVRKQQERERELPLRYVSGGAERVRVSDSPSNWNPRELGGIFELYAYTVPEEDPYYANIFRMPNGRYIGVTLVAKAGQCSDIGCDYTGDNIGVFDITNDGCGGGKYDFTFGELVGSTTPCNNHYSVSVSAQPNSIVTVAYNQASIAVPVALLYRGRALAAAWVHSKEPLNDLVEAAWDPQKRTGVPAALRFESRILDAAGDPNVNPLNLIPFSIRFR